MHVRAKNISKVYSRSTVGQGMVILADIMGSIANPKYETVQAVNDVSFEIQEGERVGFIGANGAGKSTLLQILAGLTAPSSGSVDVEGHVTCIMDLGIGIREDLSGRENIYIEAESQGMSRKVAESYVDEIISFAELGAFIDNPVRTYSSGMKARLSFAMISGIDPEILIIDEALSAGDATFANKASRRIRELTNKGGITIIVSHSMAAIREMCDRVIWLRDGYLINDGDSLSVTDQYLQWARQRENENLQRVFGKKVHEGNICKGAQIEINFLTADGNASSVMETKSAIDVEISVRVVKGIISPDLSLRLERSDGLIIIDNLASRDGAELGPIDGFALFIVPLGGIGLGGGIYHIGVELINNEIGEEGTVLAYRHAVLKIENPFIAYGNPLLLSESRWTILE